MLADAVQMNHWVCLVGRNSLHDLRNRHIFYLEGMQDVLYNIRAPVMNYHFEGQEQSDRNRISITEPELYSHF